MEGSGHALMPGAAQPSLGDYKVDHLNFSHDSCASARILNPESPIAKQ